MARFAALKGTIAVIDTWHVCLNKINRLYHTYMTRYRFVTIKGKSNNFKFLNLRTRRALRLVHGGKGVLARRGWSRCIRRQSLHAPLVRVLVGKEEAWWGGEERRAARLARRPNLRTTKKRWWLRVLWGEGGSNTSLKLESLMCLRAKVVNSRRNQ